MKAKYLGCTSDMQARWAGCTDPRPVLVVGQVYDVARVDVHSAHTKVDLVGVEGRFNSVCFELTDD